jgi:hypothetical protein
MYNDYKKQQQGIRDAFRKQLESDKSSAEKSSNAEYDNAARQNYINYMQARKRLPSELNALGIRGGASESSALRLGTNYGSNVASNEAARATALANLRQQYEDKLASYDEEWDNKLQQAYLTAIENQLNWEQAQKDAEAAKKKSGGGGGGRRSYRSGYGGYGGYGSGADVDVDVNGGDKGKKAKAAKKAVSAAQKRGQAMTAYYKNAVKSSGSSNNKKKSKWNYHINGESSTKWWG